MNLSEEGETAVAQLADSHGLSTDAVKELLVAVSSGGGTLAQFNHPELGGAGQWMMGGMTMTSDSFNHSLKAKIDGVCTALSKLLDEPHLFRRETRWGARLKVTRVSQAGPGCTPRVMDPWWGEGLGRATTIGSQNGVRYAYFPDDERLALENDGRLTLYDTKGYEITGVSQEQSNGWSLCFATPEGMVSPDKLPVVSSEGDDPNEQVEILDTIERLAEFRKKGILSDEEFNTKKAELLGRL